MQPLYNRGVKILNGWTSYSTDRYTRQSKPNGAGLGVKFNRLGIRTTRHGDGATSLGDGITGLGDLLGRRNPMPRPRQHRTLVGEKEAVQRRFARLPTEPKTKPRLRSGFLPKLPVKARKLPKGTRNQGRETSRKAS
jgi:hypothetical protein